jgi:outer membrane lipoprotein SlyB
MKGTKIELIPLESKLAAAVDAEAKQKECDYILYANVAHKKGGGGFGGLGSLVAQSVSAVGYGTGSRVGSVVGQVAAQSVITASTMSANIKSKDELTLEVKMNQTAGAPVLTKQAKAKAKSNGEDIITPVVEQIAQAIFDAVAKQPK